MDSLVLSPCILYCSAKVSRCCACFSYACRQICLNCFCALRSLVWHSGFVCGVGVLCGLDILDFVVLMAEERLSLLTNCRKWSFNSLTRRLASLSSGDQGGRALRLTCCSALSNAVVMSLSIAFRSSRIVALWGLDWTDWIR